MRRHTTLARDPSLRPFLAGLGIAAVLVTATEIALIADGPVTAKAEQMVMPLTGLVYCLVSLAAWPRRPGNRTCALLMFAGLAWFAAALKATGAPGLIAVGEIVAVLPVAVVIHLLFAFPSGVVSNRLDRYAVAAGYLAAIVLQAPAYLFGSFEAPYDLLVVAERPAIADAGAALQVLCGWAIVVVLVISLRRRLRESAPRQRQAMRPFVIYGVFALVAIPVIGNLLPLAVAIDSETILAAQRLVVAGIPLAAVATMLTGGFARVGAIEELDALLGPGEGTDLREVLARLLGDDSLALSFRLDDGTLVDGTGRPAPQPAPNTGHQTHEVVVDGRGIAVIAFDPTLIGDIEDVAAAGRIAAILIERERLTAELLASDRELRRSRARVIEAADGERQRIARDLHDGLVSRLLLLAVRTDQMLSGLPASSADRLALTLLRDELERSISELRGLVQGMMPAGLIEVGLGAAVEDLTDRMPLATRLEVLGVTGLTPELERTAYFVVSEAAANAVKHADADSILVRLAGDRTELRIEVTDDGRGGAAAGAGTGLRSMADRVEAYGGSLTVRSPLGDGTQIVAALPLDAAGSQGSGASDDSSTAGRTRWTVA